MLFYKIPNDREHEFHGDARYYYVVSFDVPSKQYEGKIMVPSDEKLEEDDIFQAAQDYLMDHFKNVFGKVKFAAEVKILEAYDRMAE
ncbi:hypothetical protein [Paenibacillus sp. XY044]|uniref:hypothetical protein n=1 Tax=Paenibacillus sp. XY044 TaxID=2026089 RepID=UPI000B97DC85|nr:hypothetical protein [Paenibacillus sp. XY044]OZB98067.1 hypothetical protein CJP46_02555 [Paenibacillus sp. XY044]